MRVGSLFSGYGGLDLAVGGDLAWYAEVEPAACKVMEAHYPGVPNIGDVTKVDWSQVEPVDVITGGYPCQPFSNAGMRKGTKDERHLWPYVRDALRAVRPAAAVLENVRGHLTLGFDVVLGDLADLGWSARWGVVRAADAGAPHNRARLFIVAYPEGNNGDGRPTGHNPQHAVKARPDEVSPRGNDCHVANAAGNERAGSQPDNLQARGPAELGERAGSSTNPSGERHGGGQGPTGVGRVGSETESSRRQTSTARQESGTGSAENVADADQWRLRRHGICGGLVGTDPGQRAASAEGRSALTWGQYAPAVERWQSVIGRPAPAPTIQRAERDRLNPAFVEWMMGLPEGWVTGHGLSASQELKMLGNGVVPQQARLALQLLGGVA